MQAYLSFYAGYKNATHPHFQCREANTQMTSNDAYANAYNLYLNKKYQELQKLYDTTSEEHSAYFLAKHFWEHENDTNAAFKILYNYPSHFESSLLIVYILISLNCFEEAKRKVDDLYAKFSEYDIIVQYMEALVQVSLSLNTEEVQNAYLTFQEIYQSYGPNDHLANLLCICSMKLNNMDQAFDWNNKIKGEFKPTENALNALTNKPFRPVNADTLKSAIAKTSNK